MFGFFRLLRLVLLAFIALAIAWWIVGRAEGSGPTIEFVAAPVAVFPDRSLPT